MFHLWLEIMVSSLTCGYWRRFSVICCKDDRLPLWMLWWMSRSFRHPDTSYLEFVVHTCMDTSQGYTQNLQQCIVVLIINLSDPVTDVADDLLCDERLAAQNRTHFTDSVCHIWIPPPTVLPSAHACAGCNILFYHRSRTDQLSFII